VTAPGEEATKGAASREAAEATKGSAIKLVTEILARLIGLFTTLLLARRLGAADFGTFGKLSVVAVILAEAADLGLQGTAGRALVARTHSLAGLSRAKIAISLAVVGLVGLSLPMAPVLGPLVLFFVLAGWSEFLGVALRARGARLSESAVIFCLRTSGLLLVGAALLRGLALPGVAWAHVLSAIPPVALASLLLARRPPIASPQDPSLGATLRESAPLAVNGGLALLSLRVEFLVLSVLRAGRETGLFLAALRIVEFLYLVPSAVAAGAMPALTREALRGEGPVRRRTAALLAFLAVPAAVGLFLVAPGLLVLLFGGEYAPAASPLRLLAPALVPFFLNGLLTSALIAAGRAHWLPRLTAVRVLVAGVLAFVLVPSLGARGAALGFLASELLLLALGTRAARAAGFPVATTGPVARAALASLPMATAVALADASLPVSLVVGLVAYAATLVVLWRARPGLVHDLVDVRLR
jgi:O-antigen/teichoic acid export membrane protein